MLHQHMLRLKSQSCHMCKCCHQPSSSTSSPKLPKAVRHDMIYAWRCKDVGIIQLLVHEYCLPLQCWSWAMRWHAHVDGHGLSMHRQPACIMRTCMSYCPAGPALTSTLCRRHPSVLYDRCHCRCQQATTHTFEEDRRNTRRTSCFVLVKCHSRKSYPPLVHILECLSSSAQ